MEIRFSLKYNDQDDLTEPFGIVVITDGKATVAEPDSFLDEWLDSLIEGLRNLKLGKSYRGFVSEPYELIFEPVDDGATIQYGNNTVRVDNLEDLDRAVSEAAEYFLRMLYKIGEPVNTQLLNRIIAFAHERSGVNPKN